MLPGKHTTSLSTSSGPQTKSLITGSTSTSTTTTPTTSIITEESISTKNIIDKKSSLNPEQITKGKFAARKGNMRKKKTTVKDLLEHTTIIEIVPTRHLGFYIVIAIFIGGFVTIGLLTAVFKLPQTRKCCGPQKKLPFGLPKRINTRTRASSTVSDSLFMVRPKNMSRTLARNFSGPLFPSAGTNSLNASIQGNSGQHGFPVIIPNGGVLVPRQSRYSDSDINDLCMCLTVSISY